MLKITFYAVQVQTIGAAFSSLLTLILWGNAAAVDAGESSSRFSGRYAVPEVLRLEEAVVMVWHLEHRARITLKISTAQRVIIMRTASQQGRVSVIVARKER